VVWEGPKALVRLDIAKVEEEFAHRGATFFIEINVVSRDDDDDLKRFPLLGLFRRIGIRDHAECGIGQSTRCCNRALFGT
jgi:hypothetical protein